jgi:hypothetical protein
VFIQPLAANTKNAPATRRPGDPGDPGDQDRQSGQHAHPWRQPVPGEQVDGIIMFRPAENGPPLPNMRLRFKPRTEVEGTYVS